MRAMVNGMGQNEELKGMVFTEYHRCRIGTSNCDLGGIGIINIE